MAARAEKFAGTCLLGLGLGFEIQEQEKEPCQGRLSEIASEQPVLGKGNIFRALYDQA